MKNILLQVKTDIVVAETISNTDSATLSMWLWVALIEFTFIIFLLFRLNKKGKDLKFGDLPKGKMKDVKKYEVDMDNLMNSINGSKDLYKELSRTCHPDRFINSDKQKLAEEIFQEISNHKRDFKKLTELKERAIAELNIYSK
jgi:hypothetical protein